MERNKNTVAYLSDLGRQLESAELTRLDLDELKDRLAELSRSIGAYDQLASDHALLREDIERRIGGMIKALAAVDRKQDRLEEAVTAVEELPGQTVEELLRSYRRVSARFRDSFPGSFGLLRSRRKEAE